MVHARPQLSRDPLGGGDRGVADAKRSGRALRLRISLREIEPKIWRVLVVRESSSLAQLHSAIQRAMGWTNSHLHDFEIHGQRFTDLETWEPFDEAD